MLVTFYQNENKTFLLFLIVFNPVDGNSTIRPPIVRRLLLNSNLIRNEIVLSPYLLFKIAHIFPYDSLSMVSLSTNFFASPSRKNEIFKFIHWIGILFPAVDRRLSSNAIQPLSNNRILSTELYHWLKFLQILFYITHLYCALLSFLL